MRPITNSDYREQTAPIFAKLGILDILQVDSLQIAKYKFYYHNQLLPPMFLSSFPENRQVHSYDTRIANCYWPRNRRTNLQGPNQGPTIWNSLPKSITGLTSFFSFKRKVIDLLVKWVRIGRAAHSHSQLNYKHIDNRGGLPPKPGGLLEISSPYHTVKPV